MSRPAISGISLRRRNVLIQVEEVRRHIRNRASFALPASFIAVMPERSARLGNEFGAAALDEIASFGDDVLGKSGPKAECGLPRL